MKQKIIEIIDELRVVLKQQEMNVSDDVLFTNACSFLRGEMANKKWGEKNLPQTKPSNNETSPSTLKPTLKQLDILYKNNVDIDAETLTRQEATKLIKELPYFKNKDEKSKTNKDNKTM